MAGVMGVFTHHNETGGSFLGKEASLVPWNHNNEFILALLYR